MSGGLRGPELPQWSMLRDGAGDGDGCIEAHALVRVYVLESVGCRTTFFIVVRPADTASYAWLC